MPQSAKRKQLGIYYTPPELTSRIVQYTVEELIAERFADPAVEFGIPQRQARRNILPEDEPFWRGCLDILRNLKIVDPACGSGAFSFQAYNVLEPRYSKSSATLDAAGRPMAPNWPTMYRIWLSLKDNFYGVDLSPEAVEITQLALWIRSATPGKPLPRSRATSSTAIPGPRFGDSFRRTLTGRNSFRKCSIGNRLLTPHGSHAEPRPSEPRPLGSESRSAPESTASLPHSRGSGSKSNAHSECLAYFITFHAYGSWLHGTDRGSVDPKHNVPGTNCCRPMKRTSDQNSSGLSTRLSRSTLRCGASLRKPSARLAITEAGAYMRFTCAPNHVHTVVTATDTPEKVMNDFKAYATRALVKAGLFAKNSNVWSRHGSTPYLWSEKAVADACLYVVEGQGAPTANL